MTRVGLVGLYRKRVIFRRVWCIEELREAVCNNKPVGFLIGRMGGSFVTKGPKGTKGTKCTNKQDPAPGGSSREQTKRRRNKKDTRTQSHM